jgi:hypothetical protein
MAREADFSLKVIEALAKRAGYRCSFPQCLNQTIGPSAEGPTKVSNTGDAAHIVAASSGAGARRANNGLLSNEKLTAIENGVWMCAYHARIVDRDEITYTIPMLEKWRAITEHKALLRQQLGRDIDFGLRELSGILLAEHKIELKTLGSENQEIGEALLHCGVHEIWGDSLAKAVRDLSIEMIRNAFQHGSAVRFSISIEPKRIVLKDDGVIFRYDEILIQERKSGGAAAIQRIMDQYSNRVVLSQTHSREGNQLTVALIHSLSDISEVTECSYTPTRKELYTLRLPIPTLPQCDKIYLLLPPYASYSDAFSLVHILKQNKRDLKQYIIIAKGLSEGLVTDIRTKLPECSFMILPD